MRRVWLVSSFMAFLIASVAWSCFLHFFYGAKSGVFVNVCGPFGAERVGTKDACPLTKTTLLLQSSSDGADALPMRPLVCSEGNEAWTDRRLGGIYAGFYRVIWGFGDKHMRGSRTLRWEEDTLVLVCLSNKRDNKNEELLLKRSRWASGAPSQVSNICFLCAGGSVQVR